MIMHETLVQITRRREPCSETPLNPVMVLSPEQIPSEVLRRLVEEVRNDAAEGTSPYSRFHNRHNRSGYGRWGQ